MWPILLDMTKEESMQHLRCLEIDAFSGLVSALRAQGSLDSEKLKLLKDTGSILHISQERHKAEIRRVVNDERLNTIAYHLNGEKHCAEEWADEGQRLIPLMPRVAPQTAYSAIADEVADTASKINKQLPSPSCTERKRPQAISPPHSNPSTSEQCNKSMPFRLSEPEIKKRKLSLNMENTNLTPHLMGPPKISKIQQIYRQKTKVRQKEQQMLKLKPQEIEKSEFINMQLPKPHISQQAKTQPKLTVNQISTVSATSQNSPKINILQNISITSTSDEAKTVESTITETEIRDVSIPGCSSDNTTTKIINKVINPLNKVNQVTIKTTAGASDLQKTIKMCAPRKTISKTVTTSSGQKLIVVSNPQTLTTSSILQRTLTTLPLKNISVKSLDKFKIMTSTTNSTIATPIQLQNSKQKIVTVRTTASKKMIPFSQVQVRNTKGEIKVLPLGGKIISKSNTSIAPSYFINAINSNESTKSTTSTPLIMCAQTQENSQIDITNTHYSSQESTNVPLDSTNVNNEHTLHKADVTYPTDINNMHVKTMETLRVVENIESENVDLFEVMDNLDNVQLVQNEESVDVELDNVESVNVIENVVTMDVVEDDECKVSTNINKHINHERPNNMIMTDICETKEIRNKLQPDVNSYYILDGDHTSNEIVIDSLDIPQPLDVLNIVGNLDPSTGQYSRTDNEREHKCALESQILETDGAVAVNLAN